MENLHITKGIWENLDLRLLITVSILLEQKISKLTKEDIDYLQIFEIKNNKLVHRQEVPEQSEEYILKGNFKNTKIWVVRNEDINFNETWKIMFPEEY